ncbi:MAG: hypothetical protein CMJ83_18725 [Planctomycetes bacterium]|nr:hypothetical protein [Planctomycetota bacterium]
MRTFCLVGFVVIAVTLAWWLLWDDGARDDVSSAEVTDPVGSSSSANSRSDTPAVTTSPYAELDLAGSDEAGITFDPSDPLGRLVRVVHKETYAPVPGAIVVMGTEDGGTGNGLRRVLTTMQSPLGLLLRNGRHYRCDQNGEVKVSWNRRSSDIAAWKGDRYGFLYFQAADPVVIEISRAPGIEVVVHDLSGAPAANVPVGLRIRQDNHLNYMMSRATTDGEGRARIGLEGSLRSSGGRKFSDVYVALDLPLPLAVEVPVDPWHLPDDPVELTLPETGRVVVNLIPPRGGALPKVVRVVVVMLSPHQTREGSGARCAPLDG